MFKNLSIVGLVVIILILLTSSNFTVTIPKHSYVRRGTVESKLLSVVQQIEADKQREQAMVKVNEIIEILKD